MRARPKKHLMEGAIVSPLLQSPPAATTVVVRVPGELDIANACAIEAALLGAEASGADEIVLDLSELWFMGSVGLRLLLEAAERADARGHRLTIVPSPAVQRITELAGLGASLPMAA
jgi:anti-sigma B factor antagonist